MVVIALHICLRFGENWYLYNINLFNQSEKKKKRHYPVETIEEQKHLFPECYVAPGFKKKEKKPIMVNSKMQFYILSIFLFNEIVLLCATQTK